jgi:hypothetical protein
MRKELEVIVRASFKKRQNQLTTRRSKWMKSVSSFNGGVTFAAGRGVVGSWPVALAATAFLSEFRIDIITQSRKLFLSSVSSREMRGQLTPFRPLRAASEARARIHPDWQGPAPVRTRGRPRAWSSFSPKSCTACQTPPTLAPEPS